MLHENLLITKTTAHSYKAISIPFTLDLTNVMKHVKVGFYKEDGKLEDCDDTEMIVPNG